MTTYSWKGQGPSHTGAWATKTDWSPEGVPGVGDIAHIGVGTVTEDADEALLLSGDAINPGVEIEAFGIGAGAALDIGDSAGANFAILTIDGGTTSYLLGDIFIYGGGSSGSELRASGTIQTSGGGGAGTINIDGGKLLALGELTLTGSGTVAMDGGYVGGSSEDPTDTLINHATISGIGGVSAANYYAAPPAPPLSGPLNYNGLITDNYGTIDATNLAAGENFLTIEGEILHNYGTLEATNSVAGSSGAAYLTLDEGAKVYNSATAVMTSSANANITMEGGTIIDGTLTGTLAAFDTSNVIEGVGSNSDFKNDGTIQVSGALTINSADRFINDGQITIYNGGTLDFVNTNDNNITGTITIEKGGKLVTSKNGALLDTGKIVVDGGTALFNNAIPSEGVSTITATSNGGDIDFRAANDVAIDAPDGVTITLQDDGADGGLITSYKPQGNGYDNFVSKIVLDNVDYSPNLAGTWYQSNGVLGLLQVGGYGFQIAGVYGAVGTTTKFGIDNGLGNLFNIISTNGIGHSGGHAELVGYIPDIGG